MSLKDEKISRLIAGCHGQDLDPHYLAYFKCFNQQLFYEAHDVLEALWLKDRHGPNGAFHKGLIQLAGAFVHLQKNRLQPADALFNLARHNLAQYPSRHECLDVAAVLRLIAEWKDILTREELRINPLTSKAAPYLSPEGGVRE